MDVLHQLLKLLLVIISCSWSVSIFLFTFLQTIVRGSSKLGVDGSLTWLLDEFDNMSVTCSNSLRRGSPPTHPRKDSSSTEGGRGMLQENGDPIHRHYSNSERPDR